MASTVEKGGPLAPYADMAIELVRIRFKDNSVLETVFERSGAGNLAGMFYMAVMYVEVQASKQGGLILEGCTDSVAT